MERAVTRKVFRTESHPGDSRRLAKDVVDYLAAFLADGDVLHDLDIILTEACANVCRYAYGGQPGPLEELHRLQAAQHAIPGGRNNWQQLAWG